MSTYNLKHTGEEIDKKLDIVKDDQGENTVLHGDGIYREIAEQTVTSEQITSAVNSYMTENAADFKGEPGKPGKDGVTPAFSIGLIETLPAESDATASITGTTENPVLNLGIPQGARGKDGTGGNGGSAYYYKPVVIVTTAGKYWKTDGTLGDSAGETDAYIKKVSGTGVGDYVPVQEGEVYRISLGSVATVASYNVSLGVFLNDNDELVANLFDSQTGKTQEMVTVPEGATKMHFTVWSGIEVVVEKQITEPYGVINPFEIENYLNGLQQEQYTFARKTYAPFDKAYITFVNDDCRPVIDTIVDVFEEKEVPLCIAAIYQHFTNVASSSGTVLEAVRKAVENGGEVLAHSGTVITEDNIDDFGTLYKQFAKNKEMLELYGFDVNGIILAGGTGLVTGSSKTDKWARAYYQYSDLYGNSEYGYPYYHYRTALSNYTLENAKQAVDDAISNKEWIVFYLHEWSEFAQEDMESLLDYINAKDSRELEVVTYKQLHEKFCIRYPKKVVAITATKKVTIITTEDELNTDDIEVTVYYDDGSTEIVSDVMVDLSDIEMESEGNYFLDVSYKEKTVSIPIQVLSAGSRTPINEGNITDYIYYALYSDGVFEITANAGWKVSVPNYTDGEQPWYDYMDQIQSIVCKGGQLGGLGEYSFYGASNLKNVDMSGSTATVNTGAGTFGGSTYETLKMTNANIIQLDTFIGSTIKEFVTDGVITYGSFRNTTGFTTLKLLEGASLNADNALQPNKGTLTDIYVPWTEGSDEVANAPWGAIGAEIHYNYTGE